MSKRNGMNVVFLWLAGLHLGFALWKAFGAALPALSASQLIPPFLFI